LPSGFSKEKMLCVGEASRELCSDGVAKERGPLAKGESSFLIGTEERAPPPLGFSLFNLLKPCRELRLTFQILSATRRQSLSLEI
jgi:hypothetical protein